MDTNITEIVNETIKKFSPIYIDEDEYKELLQDCNPYPYLTSSNGICTLVKKETKDSIICFIQPIATYIKVKNLLHNLDTEAITLVLEIDNGVKIIEKEFPRTILTKMEIKSLLPFGVKFFENYSETLIKYLVMTESQAETLHIHTSLGWGSLENNTAVFKCSEFLYPSNSIINMKSTYRGNLDLHPRGTLEAWLEMFKSEVIGNIPLTVCALLGFASPLLAAVTDTFDLGSIIISISNQSSKGKTTSAMLVTSIFSNPRLNCGTMRSFNSTQNSLVTFLSQTTGIPVAFDEASVYNGNFPQLIYLLSSGVEKSRLDGNSEMKPEKSWKSIILTTSEFALIEETDANGLKARCFPIQEELTKSASNADHIKNTVASNFGTVGKKYIQWLLDNKENNIIDDYVSMKNILIDESSKEHEPSSLTHRILSKLAVVFLAAHYVSECFNLNIDINSVQDYLLNIEQRVSEKTDFARNALDIILQEISKNSSKFLTPDRTSGQNIVGKITEQKDFKTIAILKTEFQAYCKKDNIQNSHKVLTNLKQAGILQCENDRLTMRIRLDQKIPVQTCYVFQISDAMVTRSNHLSQSIRNFPKGSSEGDINF